MLETNIKVFGNLNNHYTKETNFLISRSESFNKALNKGFIYGNSYLIAGMSGVGKSYFLTQLINDFMIIPHNVNLKPTILLYSHTNPNIQLCRLVANNMQVSYNYIFNKQYNRKEEKYIQTDSQKIKEQVNKVINYELYYITDDLNINRLEDDIKLFTNSQDKLIIVIIDDLFSIRRDGERDDFEFSNNLALFINRLRRSGVMIICTTKLSSSIEQIERIVNPKFHYPVKNDIYQNNNISWAFNNIFILHRPELLNINRYSLGNLDSTRLVHLNKVKTNEGTLGDIWFENVLDCGHFKVKTNQNFNKIS